MRENYPNGLCPDCNLEIPDGAGNGSVCEGCGHTFWDNETATSEQYLAEMDQEMKERE